MGGLRVRYILNQPNSGRVRDIPPSHKSKSQRYSQLSSSPARSPSIKLCIENYGGASLKELAGGMAYFPSKGWLPENVAVYVERHENGFPPHLRMHVWEKKNNIADLEG
ncbi:hypothetical protein NPIL_237391 [Nephila pilipes]|uniref:Uncharacterized protein n=1 Tax=Nephila pilipes TaxID=299642 RepID=A0A8X6Q3X8_NEPPI|nr:hypothetical protein NPIL_237391 [Nephila pilipes]